MKHKIGDRVKIVRGPITFDWDKNGELCIKEHQNESVGKTGIIVKAKKTQGIDNYSVHYPCGFGGKAAWFTNKDFGNEM